jgi:kinesin family protein 2/24
LQLFLLQHVSGHEIEQVQYQIIHISFLQASADHTINTLRYADRIKEKGLKNPSSNQQALGQPVRVVPKASILTKQNSRDVADKKVDDHNERRRDSERKMAKDAEDFEFMEQFDISQDDLLRDEDNETEDELHRTVQDLFEEEEGLLNLHMSIIQENAELLTEEGVLLQKMQGDDGDIDAYAYRLDQILIRKIELITMLRERLAVFREQLKLEETVSKKLRGF